MKTVTILLSLLLSSNLIAANISRVADGANARCSIELDVFQSKLNGLYSLSNPQVEIQDENIIVHLDINFFECQKINNEFKIVRVKYNSEQDLEFMGKQLKRTELEREVKVVNSSSEIIASVDVKSEVESDNNRISIIMKKEDMEKNQFSNAMDKGDLFTTLFMTSVREVESNNVVVDRDRISFGQFRLFINSQSQKAFLQ